MFVSSIRSDRNYDLRKIFNCVKGDWSSCLRMKKKSKIKDWWDAQSIRKIECSKVKTSTFFGLGYDSWYLNLFESDSFLCNCWFFTINSKSSIFLIISFCVCKFSLCEGRDNDYCFIPHTYACNGNLLLLCCLKTIQCDVFY